MSTDTSCGSLLLDGSCWVPEAGGARPFTEREMHTAMRDMQALMLDALPWLRHADDRSLPRPGTSDDLRILIDKLRRAGYFGASHPGSSGGPDV